MITIYRAISSLTTSLPHTIYPLTVRLRAIGPFFLTHIAHRTYPSTTVCLLTVSDKKGDKYMQQNLRGDPMIAGRPTA